MRFAGELIDTETSLYHLRARQYDPGSGRFLSVDPLSPELLAARRRPQSHVGCRLRTLAASLIWAASSMTLAAAADSTTPEAPITSPERALLRTGPSQEVRWEPAMVPVSKFTPGRRRLAPNLSGEAANERLATA